METNFFSRNRIRGDVSLALVSSPDPSTVRKSFKSIYKVPEKFKMATKRRHEDNEFELSSHNVDHFPSTENVAARYLESGGVHSEEETFTQYCEQRGNWIAYFDWNTNCFYYQNINDYTVQWEQPVEWENLPSQYTTEFGDYSSFTENNYILKTEWEYSSKDDLRRRSEEIESKNIEYLKRPAKRQMDPEKSKKVHWIPEGASEYNIWYDRWIGEHWGRERTLGRN
mgnify:CR=1 FL=1